MTVHSFLSIGGDSPFVSRFLVFPPGGRRFVGFDIATATGTRCLQGPSAHVQARRAERGQRTVSSLFQRCASNYLQLVFIELKKGISMNVMILSLDNCFYPQKKLK